MARNSFPYGKRPCSLYQDKECAWGGSGPTGAADTAMQRPSRQMVGGQVINCPDLLECAWGESRALAGREGKFRRVGFILQIRGEGSV